MKHTPTQEQINDMRNNGGLAPNGEMSEERNIELAKGVVVKCMNDQEKLNNVKESLPVKLE